jgi:hypothetical protein
MPTARGWKMVVKTTALDGDTNLNRGWNPNYQEGMVGMMLGGISKMK